MLPNEDPKIVLLDDAEFLIQFHWDSDLRWSSKLLDLSWDCGLNRMKGILMAPCMRTFYRVQVLIDAINEKTPKKADEFGKG